MKHTEAANFLLNDEVLRSMREHTKDFSETALYIWRTKYAAKGEDTPEETNLRVVSEMATANDDDVWKALLQLMNARVVAFNSPVYFNLGVKEKPQLSACFILGVDDTMDSIVELSSLETTIFRHGSGAGCNYSNLRARDSKMSNGGIASGPVSFMRSLDAMAGAIKSGGRLRRAARIAILDSDHPDILEFIQCKALEEEKLWKLREAGLLPDDHMNNPSAFFQNTNHTVRLTDEDIREDNLIPEIAKAIWRCGDPGVQFSDIIREALPADIRDLVHACNPCHEHIFIDNSACNLASINVAHRFFDNQQEEKLAAVASILTFAMDRIVDLSHYPSEAIRENSIKYRPLGLGITGFGEYCMLNGVPYGGAECCKQISEIMRTIQVSAKETCPKNYQHTLIAPTGTISLFLDAESTGIEPIYAESTTKYLAGDGQIKQTPDCVHYARTAYGDHVVKCAVGKNAVTPEEHIKVVAAAQEFCCGGISKTVNLPHDTPPEEIEKLIRYGWRRGCKALAFYRDGSKATQPLIADYQKEEEKKESTISEISPRIRLSSERRAVTRKFNVGGEEGYITVGLYDNGSPGEIFVRVSKVGSTLQGFIDQLGIAWSLALQYGVPLAALVRKAKGTSFAPAGFTGDDIRYASSIVDYLAKWLEKRFLQEEEDEDYPDLVCVEPEAEIVDCSGPPCPECGSLTQPSGTCYVCLRCGSTTGCG